MQLFYINENEMLQNITLEQDEDTGDFGCTFPERAFVVGIPEMSLSDYKQYLTEAEKLVCGSDFVSLSDLAAIGKMPLSYYRNAQTDFGVVQSEEPQEPEQPTYSINVGETEGKWYNYDGSITLSASHRRMWMYLIQTIDGVSNLSNQPEQWNFYHAQTLQANWLMYPNGWEIQPFNENEYFDGEVEIIHIPTGTRRIIYVEWQP